MSVTDRTPGAVAIGVALAVVFVGLVAFAPTAAAQESDGYVLEQGDRCIDVDPVRNDSQTAEAFYDYRNETYSSQGTLEYQQDNTSTLLLYEGAEGTSLVFVHDRYHEDTAAGTNGSHARITLDGLPSGSDWAIRDDNYGGEDDSYDMSGTTRTAEWRWDRARTDGAAYRLGTGDFSVGLNASFNEDRWSGTYHGRIEEWSVVTGTDGGVQRTTLETNVPATVSPGSCGGTGPDAPTAALVAPDTAEVGETVTLDASDSETGANPSYEWSVDGDVLPDASGQTHELSFSEPGTYDVRVNVTDDGGFDTANRTVEVTQGPTARFESDATSAEAGQDIVFNASESAGDISTYEWTFGDGNAATGEEVAHTFEDPGTYDVQLTVVDDAGNQDSTTKTVEITQPGPTAELTGPDRAATGESVTFDASESTTGSNPTYDWYVDRQDVSGAGGPTLDVTFSEPGTHQVRVEVTDGGGTDAADATVEVEGDLTAAATADDTNVEPGETVTFDGSGSSGGATTYYWNFDDGTTDSGETTTHAYDQNGTYLVELVVENANGETARDTVEVTVERPGEESDGGSDGSSDDGSDGGSDDWWKPYWGEDGGSGEESEPADDSTGDGPTVELDNGTILVRAGDVDAGDRVAVDVPRNGSTSEAIEVSTIQIVPATDADDLTVRFEPIDRPVPGRVTERSALDPMTNTDLESVTYEFAVDPELLAAAGVTPENLSAYVQDGGWQPVETATQTEGDRLVASATVGGDDTVGVGAEGPAMYVTDVRSDGPVTDSTLDLEMTVRNTGTEAGERNVTVATSDETRSVPVSLAPAEETTLETNVTVADPADLELRAGTTRPDLLVVTGADLTVEPQSLTAGESVTVEAVLRNHGDGAGEYAAELVLADNVASVERIRMEPGEERTVTFEQRIESPGTYRLSVGGASETVTVESGGDGANVERAAGDGAGFGAMAALAGFVAAFLLGRRRAG